MDSLHNGRALTETLSHQDPKPLQIALVSQALVVSKLLMLAEDCAVSMPHSANKCQTQEQKTKLQIGKQDLSAGNYRLSACLFGSVMLNNYQRDLKSIENFLEKKSVISSVNLLNSKE